MLVLTRRVGEQIVIGSDIRVTVLSIKGDKVRIGVAAPDGVRMDREEIHQRRQRTPPPDTSLENSKRV